MLIIDKEHRGEHLPGRHLGLDPAGGIVVGVEDMTTIAHNYQALTDAGDVQQQLFHCFRRFDRVTDG
ncbi:hypothetical protein D9M69_683820 [compost metagenome]